MNEGQLRTNQLHGIIWGHITTMCVYTCMCLCMCTRDGFMPGGAFVPPPPPGNDSSCLLIILLCMYLLLCVCACVISSVGSCLANNQVDIDWSARDAWLLTVYSALLYIIHYI